MTDLHCFFFLFEPYLPTPAQLAKGLSLCIVRVCQSYHTHLGVIVMSSPGVVARAAAGIVSTVIALVG